MSPNIYILWFAWRELIELLVAPEEQVLFNVIGLQVLSQTLFFSTEEQILMKSVGVLYMHPRIKSSIKIW